MRDAIVILLSGGSQLNPTNTDILHYITMSYYTEICIYHALRRVYAHLNR